MMIYNKIDELIENSKKISIYVHVNPDGDALGSARALQLYLNSIGKQADIFSSDEIADYFAFLNIENKFEVSTDVYDLAIALDVPEIKRIGKCISHFYKIKNSICIDHHTGFTPFSTQYISKPDASSTGILLYKYLKNKKCVFTPEICIALYTAIASDTGCFVHSNTTAAEHKAVAELMKNTEVDWAEINYHLFKEKSLKQVLVIKRALEHMKFYCNDNMLLTYMEQSDLEEINANEDDTASIVGFINGIEQIKVAVVLLQKDTNEFRVSIRSKEDYAKRIASEFGGGGHLQAAGCRLFGNINEAINQITNVAKDMFK